MVEQRKYKSKYGENAFKSLNEIPKPDDAADALGIAICHINNIDMYRKLKHR